MDLHSRSAIIENNIPIIFDILKRKKIWGAFFVGDPLWEVEGQNGPSQSIRHHRKWYTHHFWNFEEKTFCDLFWRGDPFGGTPLAGHLGVGDQNGPSQSFRYHRKWYRYNFRNFGEKNVLRPFLEGDPFRGTPLRGHIGVRDLNRPSQSIRHYRKWYTPSF